MHFKRTYLFIASASVALWSVGIPQSAEAQSKTKSSVPKPFSASERQEGAKNHPQILREFGGAMQSPQTDYVVRVGKGIAVQSGLGDAQSDFTVTMLNSSVNNAFAIPGGYVYITRQLVALCNSEAEMAGVLGHEVGHTAARHGRKRQQRGNLANILGIGGSILGGLLGNSGGLAGLLGSGLQQYSGFAAQFLTLSYSRKQEEEADDLGIRYLSNAGYDPSALSSMLTSLALQTSLDARLAGQSNGRVPEWASTHPDPAKRVVRASTKSRAYPANPVRKADTHLAAINGMLYGDDPEQGVVEGQQFLHPVIRLKFVAPTGFGLQNGTDAVSINGNGGQAIFTQGAFNGNETEYVAAAFRAVSGNQQAIPAGQINRTTINGVPAFYSTALVNTQQGQRALTVFAYEWSDRVAYHFVTVTAANSNPFDRMFQSVSRLSANEAASIRPRKIRVVSVARGETASTLAARMAYGTMRTERFLALNGMMGNVALSTGQKVKIVTY